MDQNNLAKRTKVTQRAIYCIERNIARPRKKTQDRIIQAFSDTGLCLEPLPDGGFQVSVPSWSLHRSSAFCEQVVEVPLGKTTC
jgi:hypothetical protein